MSQGTKLFGFQVPVNSKILVGGLFAIVAGLGLYNFIGSGDETPGNSRSAIVKANPTSTTSVPSLSGGTNALRHNEIVNRNKPGVLKLKPVDPASVVDPTLKLALLDRVRSVKMVEGGRNLFESGPDVVAPLNLPAVPKVAAMLPKPIEKIGPMPPPPPPPPPPLNIPLRYYGFVRPGSHNDGNRGYFMDGDNILMATEGDVLKSRFLVVALSPNTARVEDIQLKKGQDLQLIPEAVTPP